MNKRTDFIDIIKDNTDNPQCSKLLSDMHQYYIINDLDTGGGYSEIFHALYLDNYKTYDDILETFFISTISLYRYRIKFNRLAKILAPQDLIDRFQPFKK